MESPPPSSPSTGSRSRINTSPQPAFPNQVGVDQAEDDQAARPRRYRGMSPLRLFFGTTRLRVGIPVLFILLPLIFGFGVSYMIDSMLDMRLDREVAHLLAQLRLYVVILVVTNSVLGLLLGLTVVYAAIRPLEQVQRVADELAEGKFTTRLDMADAPGEVSDMGRSFNTMIETLNKVFHERNRFMMEQISGSIITLTRDGIVTSVNAAAVEMMRCPEEEMIGARLLEKLDTRPVNAELVTLLRECLSGDRHLISQQVFLENEDGVVTAVAISTTPLYANTGDPNASGGSDFHSIVVNMQNLEKLQEFSRNMNRADRLAAIGTFATGMAHEIRNPLGSIRGLTQLIMQGQQENEDAQNYGEVILRETDRLDRLLRELLSFAEPRGATIDRVILSDLVKYLNDLCRAKLEEKELEVPECELRIEEVPDLSLPPDKIHQAVLNILQNGYEAAVGKGQLLVRLHQPDKDRVRISITNTGSSIPQDQLDKIFEPFYTTKEEGTGLGLAISYQIIGYMGGRLQVQSGDNSVTFLIDLPAYLGPQQTSLPALQASDSASPPL